MDPVQEPLSVFTAIIHDTEPLYKTNAEVSTPDAISTPDPTVIPVKRVIVSHATRRLF
jgi:hypothetical protein